MKFSSLLNFVLLALMLFLIYFLYGEIKEKQQLELQLQNETQMVEEFSETQRELSTWRRIDTLLMSSKYSQLEDQYSSLLNTGAIDSSSYFKRMRYLHGFRDRQSRHQQNRSSLQNELSETREQLRISKDVNSILAEDKAAFLDSLFSIKQKVNLKNRKLSDSLRKSKSEMDSLLKKKKELLQLTDPRGNSFVYLGPVKEGKASGTGIGIWLDGGMYEGQWEDNHRHGKGRFEWTDGEVYEGTYENGKRSGEGTYIWTSGQKYVGEWKDDKRSGYGVLYNEYGNVSYNGQWQNDSPLRQ